MLDKVSKETYHKKSAITLGYMKEAIEILDQIEEQVNTCCAITMFPEDVVELIEKLRKILEEHENI